MDRMDFNQAVIRVKVLEKRLLSRGRIERMVDAKDMDEVFRILGETEYQQHLSLMNRNEDYEKVLYAELKRVYALVRELTSEESISKLLALKYDYHNLKVMVKEKISGKSLENLYVSFGTWDLAKIKTAFIGEDYKDLDEHVATALKDTLTTYEKSGDPQDIEIVLDRYYYHHLTEVAKSTGVPLFMNYVKNLVDFTNVKSLIRVKKMDKDVRFLEGILIEGGSISIEKILYSINDPLDTIIEKFRREDIGKPLVEGLEAFRRTGRLTEFEKIADNDIMRLHESSKSTVFGPEPIFSYLFAKETEIKVLRIIMVSKINKLSPEVIRERLRDLYV